MEFEDLERLYGLTKWYSNPRTREGRRRLEGTITIMKELLKHEWVQAILTPRKEVRVVDVCSGGGIGGFAFAKVLVDQGYSVSLDLVDLRHSELEEAKKFKEEFLPSIELNTYAINALELHKIGKKYDVALFWGLSAPHFDPWDFTRLLSSISRSLVDDGVLFMEEGDRIQSIVLRTGYQYVWPEGFGEDDAIVSIHRGYDIVRGRVRRIIIDLEKGTKVAYPVYLWWTIASLAAYAWVFFKDIDIYTPPISSRYSRYIIIARKPRRVIKPEDFDGNPTILVKK